MTPYYEHGGITIYHGDCREILPGLKAPAVITDPPYGFGSYVTDTYPDIPLVMGCGETVALFGYPETLCQWCIDIGRAPIEWVTWWPTNAVAKAGGRHGGIPRQVEAIAIFGTEVDGAAIRETRSTRSTLHHGLSDTVRLGDVWRDASPGIGFNSHLRRHPNEKPLTLMSKLVLLCSAAGDLIIDPFMGSGTTLEAAKHNGRRAIGVELEEAHCETAAKRLSQEVLFA